MKAKLEEDGQEGGRVAGEGGEGAGATGGAGHVQGLSKREFRWFITTQDNSEVRECREQELLQNHHRVQGHGREQPGAGLRQAARRPPTSRKSTSRGAGRSRAGLICATTGPYRRGRTTLARSASRWRTRLGASRSRSRACAAALKRTSMRPRVFWLLGRKELLVTGGIGKACI